MITRIAAPDIQTEAARCPAEGREFLPARIFQINASGGGVPKLPLLQAEISTDGLEGDRQEDLRHHGGPDRALCLYSLERILALQNEGHPIIPGAAGENLTLTGLDWGEVRPGLILRLGARAVIEIVSFTEPCGKIRGLFSDGDVDRISQAVHPGWSRVYARVRLPGRIRVGDAVQWGQG